MLRHIVTLSAALAISAPLAAQPRPVAQTAPWPREVQAIYDQFKGQCIAGGGRFIPDKARFATPVEISNDGKPDWVVEIQALDCHATERIRMSDNAPESGNGYCGTAGCVVSVLVSTSRGLVESFNDNIRGWEVVKASGKNAFEISVHGTACGGFGADVCLQTLVWNGRKWDAVKRYKWTEADHLAAQKAAEAEGYDDTAFPVHEGKWIFGGTGSGAVAAVMDHPEFAAIGLRCMAGGGLGISVVPHPSTPLPAAGKPLLLDFYGSEEDIRATQPMIMSAGNGDWNGVLVPPLHALLGGRDSDLMLLASLDGGQEWAILTSLSTAGSTAALRSLDQACASAAGSASGAQAAGQAPVAPLGIVAGYYVDQTASCSDPGFEAIFYDGRRLGLMRGGGREEFEQNIVEPLGSVRKLGKGRFFLAGWSMEIAVLSPTRIQLTIQDTGAPMRWCPADQIPANFRAR